ncbi:probable LRR receptor-like serine/threonine-protein kinase At2g16250 [Phalaenopsis equestris]|uniref:probable LRR receptor-like serine/threonine-protein kinase At2g16250 n=1 Tax=Phalaenopsis equestris TaxID=78828 RepID=UPI0009E57C58|nr:probable LRR receptor-like serine/threonine-protein kinase At2g16250 [Phalaenopsis equestris]
MSLLVILLALTAFPSFTTSQAISSTDLTALFSLRASLSLRARDWPRGADPCSRWTGVGCDAAGRVIFLNLHGLRRTRLGRLSPRFAVEGLKNLTFLTSFNATGFALPGPIPVWFGLLNPKLAVVDLSHASISGEIPSSLGNLSLLVSLDLSSNLLTGSLPDNLKNLENLKNLNFGSNLLTGSLEGELFSSLSKLESITLTRNNFSGLIPGSVFSLPELKFLDVSYNDFTGNLPDLSLANFSHNGIAFDLSHNLLYGSISSEFSILSSRFNFVDVSNNYFEGSVPLDKNSKKFSFASNCFLNDSSQRSTAECEQFYKAKGLTFSGTVNSSAAPAPSPSFNSPKSNKTWKYILIPVVCGAVLLIFIAALILLFVMKCRVHSARQEMNAATVVATSPPAGAPPQPSTGENFTYDQLALATSGFGEENLIKQGHSGDLYHGVLEDGSLVVVKRIDLNSAREEDYLVELDLFGRTSHDRLITLLGHSLQKEDEKFLVYKQMPNRDLASALYKKAALEEEWLQSLDWITRLKIAIGVAEALCHLHYDFTPPLVHRDIQASSILLDDKFDVRLGSLGSVCAQEGEGHPNVISRFFRLSQTLSEQIAPGAPSASCAYDVYCFGKVLLELVTGKLGISASTGVSTNEWLENTIQYIDMNEKELITKIIDPSLIINEDLLEEAWAMSIVARSCLNPKPSKRPAMKYIRRALENPLTVVREDSNSDSLGLRSSSSGGLWNGALFGSWRRTSREIPSGSGTGRHGRSLRQSGPLRSPASGGEFSSSRRRQAPPREIFPEPDDVEED